MPPPEVCAFTSPSRRLKEIGPPDVSTFELNLGGTETRYSTSRSQVEYSRHCQFRQIGWVPKNGKKASAGSQPPSNAPVTRISEPSCATSSLKSRRIRLNSASDGGVPWKYTSTSTLFPFPGSTCIAPTSAFNTNRVDEPTGTDFRTWSSGSTARSNDAQASVAASKRSMATSHVDVIRTNPHSVRKFYG